MNRVSDRFISSRQQRISARCDSVIRRADFVISPRRDSIFQRAENCPMSQCPKRISSRMRVSACDVRDVCAWMGACRRRARTHLSRFSWDTGTVGRNTNRGW